MHRLCPTMRATLQASCMTMQGLEYQRKVLEDAKATPGVGCVCVCVLQLGALEFYSKVLQLRSTAEFCT